MSWIAFLTPKLYTISGVLKVLVIPLISTLAFELQMCYLNINI